MPSNPSNPSSAVVVGVASRRMSLVLWLIIGAGLLWLLAQAGAIPAGASAALAGSETLVLRRASFIVADSDTLPPDDAGWQATALPHRLARPGGADLTGYWYKADFALPPAGPLSGTRQPLWLYLPRINGGGAIFINGALVTAMPSADPVTHVRLLDPHLFLLPPSVLHAGLNQIGLHFASREPRTSVGVLEVGTESAVRPRFEQRLFIESTTAEISSAVCLMAAVGLLGFWLRRPQERIYGLFALCLLFWGVRTLVMRWPVVPIAYLLEWRLAYYVAHSGFVVSISIFTLHFSQKSKPFFERCLIGYAVAGCLVFAIFGIGLRGAMDSYWQLPFFLCGLYCLMQLAFFASKQRAHSSLAMGLAMLLALGLAMHDFAVQEGWFLLTDIYLMHLGVPVFLLVMAGMLLERFVGSLHSAAAANERLAVRVSEREAELARSYERLGHLERAHGATEERQRIMQDMHDGVGSQLLTTMAIVGRGTASRTDTMALLQACLDDMRLAIDSLAPDDPDLLPALGNFRFRMQARFAAAGITLAWRNHAIPDALELGTHAGLQVLRILQEALANVLKHAQAVHVTVDVYFTPQRLRIRVVDDGVGFARSEEGGEEGGRGGRGLVNMQDRAARLGATLQIDRLDCGTALTVEIPLAPAATATPATTGARQFAGSASGNA